MCAVRTEETYLSGSETEDTRERLQKGQLTRGTHQ